MATKLGKTIGPCIRGDNRTVNLTFLASDGATPINLTGGTVYFTVNSSSDPSDDTSVAFQKTVLGSSATAPTLGQHTFTLTHANTDITPGTYWYDCQFVDSTGAYLSSYRGKFIVQSDTTRT
jgi:hypothetical protein